MAEWIEREQIAVAGDDQVRVAVDRQLEKLVVGGIAADGDALGVRRQFGRASILARPSRKEGIVAAAM